jgi:hypothetical protein
MSTCTEITIPVASRDNRELPMTIATITKIHFNKKERTQNALKTFGFLMTLAFVTIFVPILHFVLVPAFFLASFIFGMDKLGEKFRNAGGKGECPKCHEQFTVQGSKWVTRITNNCDHCHEDLEMTLPSLEEITEFADAGSAPKSH